MANNAELAAKLLRAASNFSAPLASKTPTLKNK